MAMTSIDNLPKQVEVVVIYPCRLIPVDSFSAKEYKYGDKVTISREDAYEAIGLKRVVMAKEYDKAKYPEPVNKSRKKETAPSAAKK